MLPLVLCALLGERDHTPTLDDYFTLATPTEIALSADGKQLAYVRTGWADDRESRDISLHVAEVAGGKSRRLPVEKASPHGLRWGRDGKAIYYLAAAEKKGTQVWLVPAAGDGKPATLTNVEGGLRAFELSPDEKVIYALTDSPLGDPTFAELRKEFPRLDYGSGGKKVSTLWRIERETGKAERVIEGKFFAHEFAVAPDGKRVAFVHAPDDSVASFEGKSGVSILDLESKELATVPDDLFRAQSDSKTGWLEKLAWSPSGKALAFEVVYDAHPCEVILVGVGKDLTTTKLDRPAVEGKELHVRGYGSPLRWRAEGDLCLVVDVQGRSRAYCARGIQGGLAAEWVALTPGDVVVQDFAFAGKTAAYVLSTPTSFPDLHVQEGEGDVKALPTLNPQVEKWKLPSLRTITWKGPGGVDVEGILEFPPDHQGGRLPLVVAIHGGPTTCSSFGLGWSIYDGGIYLSAKGYAVLRPNYRGSTGYGDKFLLDLIGKENQADVGDVIAGAEAVVEAGFADPKRLAIMGWSNGGYLTNCAITKTNIFKAAMSGAGIIDHAIEFGLADEPAYPMVFKKGKAPWEDRAAYLSSSPMWSLGKVKTPTLIHVGANDERCPPGHSRLLYRALKDYLGVPTELIVYPGEPHGLGKGKHRLAKMKWDLAWLEKFMK